MKTLNVIMGTILMATGIGIGYVMAYIISVFYSVSLWIAGLINAPEPVAALLTLILIIFFSSIIIFIIIIAIIVFYLGLCLVFHKY